MLSSEILRALPAYRVTHVQEVTGHPSTSLQIKAQIPRSVTCPDLRHASPTDITLAVMQAGYVVGALSIPNLPPDYRYQALFLGHRAIYHNQDTSVLEANCRMERLRPGAIDIGVISINSPNLSVELMCGIPRQEPPGVKECLTPLSTKLSRSQIDEILGVYTEDLQSEIVEVGYDPSGQVYEAAVYFPPYSEIPDLTHVSARQMIQALMQAAYCDAGHQAYLGNFPLSYEEFLTRRLDFRTREHDLKYRKLLVAGTQSLLRFRLSVEGTNSCTVTFSHRPKVGKEEESFATGKMTFYLPA